jgi:putative Mn2+ efflux pump MntP
VGFCPGACAARLFSGVPAGTGTVSPPIQWVRGQASVNFVSNFVSNFVGNFIANFVSTFIAHFIPHFVGNFVSNFVGNPKSYWLFSAAV